MEIFKHPTHEIELEGTYIVKRNNEYVYLTDNTDIHNRVELHRHEDIVEYLTSSGITDEIVLEELGTSE